MKSPPLMPSRRDTLFAVIGGSLAIQSSRASAGTLPPVSPKSVAVVQRIDRDHTVDETLIVAPGARLFIAAGATLRLCGDIVAPADSIFEGPGRVDMTTSRALFARPEWWGARADDPAVDNAIPFDACLAAHPAMQLGLGDYHLPQGWTVNRSNRRVWGIGRTKDARGTRLLRHGASGAVLTLGQRSAPTEINDYVRGLDVRWIELGRTQAPAMIGDDESEWPVGLMVRHVLDARCEGLRANEHAIGYSLRGAVRSFFEDCSAFRSTARPSSRGEQFIGFDLDGRSPPIATGANASIYLIDCSVSLGAAPLIGTSIGCRLLGALSDSFFVRLETTGLDVGIYVNGLAARLTPGQRRSAHLDFTIDMPVLDQCRVAGIRMTGLSSEAMVTLRSPYVGLGSGATAAIEVSDSEGSIAIDQGQLVGTFAAGSQGLKINRVSGLSCSGTGIQGFARPIVVRGATAFDLVVAINPGATRVDGPAIVLTDCRGGYVRPRLLGAGHAPVVAVDGYSRRVTIETGAIDPQLLADVILVTRNGKAALITNDCSSFTI